MNSICRKCLLAAVGLGLGLSGLVGCQTYNPETGMTLPSGRYLKQTPQYIPPSPDYPCERELASQTAAAAQMQPLGGGRPVGPEAPMGP